MMNNREHIDHEGAKGSKEGTLLLHPRLLLQSRAGRKLTATAGGAPLKPQVRSPERVSDVLNLTQRRVN